MKLTELFNERSLTKSEEDKKEDIVKGMKKNKGDFEKRYGKEAKAVMYATATKMAKNEDAIPYNFTKQDFFDNEDENMHTENALELAKKFGTPEEQERMEKIMTAHNTRGHILSDEQEERDELVRKYYPKLEGKERNCGCGQTPCKTYGRQNEGIVEGKALTEAEFDEAAGKKDACYHKVKSRYKVWPSAYASGALVQCRKKGAANWGNSKKK